MLGEKQLVELIKIRTYCKACSGELDKYEIKDSSNMITKEEYLFALGKSKPNIKVHVNTESVLIA